MTRIEPLDDLDALAALLAQAGLPLADLAASSSQEFFGISIGPALVASVGLEAYGSVGLLRSLAVLPRCRQQGMAGKLVRFAEEHAAGRGVTSLYLLTTTAEDFFTRLGYVPTSRENAPPAIAASAQFTGLCPASAVLLSKAFV